MVGCVRGLGCAVGVLITCVGWVQMHMGVLIVCGLYSTGTTKACVFC
mgnify:FL=1